MFKKTVSEATPPLPFDPNMKRSYSSISRSTVCGSPSTMRSEGTPTWAEAAATRLGGIRVEQFDTQSTRESKTLATFVPGESATPTKVFYERQYPPMPKVKSIYTEAKKAEYDGNLELAMELYLRAVECNDRADSAIKDYAGLLHMKGQTVLAIDFMEKQPEKRKTALGFKNLLTQLKATHEREISNEHNHLPRVVLVNVKDDTIDIELNTLQAILPNCLKICQISFMNPTFTLEGFPSSKCALIEFTSHSSARKAVMVGKHDSIKCCWAPPSLVETVEHSQEVSPVQLVKGGASVKILYANADPGLMEIEWPKLILQSLPPGHKEAVDVVMESIQAEDSATTTEGMVETKFSKLTLPIPERRLPSQSIEIDISGLSEESQSSIIMDWCMNTPSPVRNMACLV
jgi:hypothetical protein